MTNSIWHKANKKPELNKYVIVRKHGFAQWKVFKFDNKTMFYEPFIDDLWAYVEDIIAAADRAERLQKGLEDIYSQLEYRACLECKHCNQQLNAIEILKDVKQLIKE